MKVKGKTSSGFEYTADTEILADLRFINICARAAQKRTKKESLLIAAELVRLILGENYSAYMRHLESIYGSVPIETAIKEVDEILQELKRKR